MKSRQSIFLYFGVIIGLVTGAAQPSYAGDWLATVYGSTKEATINRCYDRLVDLAVNDGLVCPKGTSPAVDFDDHDLLICNPLPSPDPGQAWVCECTGDVKCMPYY